MIDRRTKPTNTVFIIDDDETALLIAEEVLTSEGFEVETYTNSEEALQIVIDQRPDIVVLDVMMPRIDGYEFCARMRQNERTREIPILITTGLDDSESITKAYDAGATNFAAKPINWNIEVSRLRYMLRGADVTTALRAKEREAIQTKEDWERTFNSIQDIVTVLDTELNIIRCNATASKRIGMPASEIIGQPYRSIFSISGDSSTVCSGPPSAFKECSITCLAHRQLPIRPSFIWFQPMTSL